MKLDDLAGWRAGVSFAYHATENYEKTTRVYINRWGDLEVSAEAGQFSAGTAIPLAVIVNLLRNNGWTVLP